MLRRGFVSALPPLRTGVGRPAYTSLRALSTSTALLRRGDDEDRVPRGHVRPQRGGRRQYERIDPNEYYRQHPNQNPEQQNASVPPRAFGGFAQGPSLGGGGPWGDAAPDMMGTYSPSAVVVPQDPQGVLVDSHAAYDLLAHDALIVVRQLEMLNVFMGFEQANKYALYSADGNVVGFLAEEDRSFLSTFQRQFMHTHRPFKSVVMDKYGKPVLWIRRPFQFINSRIKVHSGEQEDGRIVGETQQQWHPWRRRYNLFQARPDDVMSQFGRVDAGFLAWDFWIKDRDDRLIATINRNFRGIGRELFTDTGQYVIRFDAAGTELDLPPGSEVTVQGQKLILPDSSSDGLTLDQRAMALATAVSIDFDYFSRHSGSGGFGLPFFFWGGGDGSSEAQRGGTGEAGVGAAGGAAGAAGAAGQAYPDSMSDDEIYGRQPGGPAQDPPVPGQQAEGFDYPASEGNGYDEVMEDPWETGASDDSGGGLFGGGGDGGSWGDWS